MRLIWTKLGVYTPLGGRQVSRKFGGSSSLPSYSCHRLPFIFGPSLSLGRKLVSSWGLVPRAQGLPQSKKTPHMRGYKDLSLMVQNESKCWHSQVLEVYA
ncbi:hypothetical protein GOODEAATRI_034128 [Goodea atripinnis]|uniref:Uncharacterized protein n=1 Tax=Goodea atripinnis TaxID=208336 RepID=A0ABV0N6F4_9TELE